MKALRLSSGSEGTEIVMWIGSYIVICKLCNKYGCAL
jgi:hypothetical protein